MDFFRPVTPSEFENLHENCRLAFIDGSGDEGSVESVRITLRGEAMQATRVPAPRDAAWVDECAGFDFGEPEDPGECTIRFVKRGECR